MQEKFVNYIRENGQISWEMLYDMSKDDLLTIVRELDYVTDDLMFTKKDKEEKAEKLIEALSEQWYLNEQ